MTAQEPDRFYYHDQHLDLVGIRGNDLPIPSDFGIETHSNATNCWRGYVMRYKIVRNKLILEGFWFNSKSDNLPEINGLGPVKTSEIKFESIITSEDWLNRSFQYEYRNLNKIIHFNGSLWLGKDFIQSEYVHMGFQSPTAYKTVLKFDFKEGIIVRVEDKSKQANSARESGTCKEPQPESMKSEDLEKWIAKRFSLDIDFYKKRQNGENDN
ncbi:MAG: hypothetical protein JW891_04925 [Candidatus Lokiarchaeota archaeon]|nr:hypothetical protein [Candidatus Lokiarchaeota archaeon]